ncbi:MAG TPA: HAMP domain-containing sensor histidine kinase [Mycobacteriales bacterium]|jgi:signal transduction histidine kinase|nr:HAMP domain-containing sensor histidine kinase [Mycobacteriales bacterium]
MIRVLLTVAWLVLGAIPLLWWLRSRRRVDVWPALPVPAALLDGNGAVLRTTGPATEIRFAVDGVPAPGRIVRSRTGDGVPLAMTGLPGGALAVALPADPVGQRRDRVLAELGARLAHDINTPLAAVFGHLDLIAHQPINDDALASVRTCERELLRLQTTAADLLAYTRLRAGGGTRCLQLAGALVEDAAAAFHDQAEALHVVFSVEVPHERVAVQASEGDIVRALRNLIANAFRYGLPVAGGDIVVSADADDTSVTFAVADRGPGLTDDELAALSQPMVRGVGVIGPGSGLGLAIVAEILAGHGSALLVAGRPGGGAVLSFTLPRTR